jgi:hypothetical protein
MWNVVGPFEVGSPADLAVVSEVVQSQNRHLYLSEVGRGGFRGPDRGDRGGFRGRGERGAYGGRGGGFRGGGGGFRGGRDDFGGGGRGGGYGGGGGFRCALRSPWPRL